MREFTFADLHFQCDELSFEITVQIDRSAVGRNGRFSVAARGAFVELPHVSRQHASDEVFVHFRDIIRRAGFIEQITLLPVEIDGKGVFFLGEIFRRKLVERNVVRFEHRRFVVLVRRVEIVRVRQERVLLKNVFVRIHFDLVDDRRAGSRRFAFVHHDVLVRRDLSVRDDDTHRVRHFAHHAGRDNDLRALFAFHDIPFLVARRSFPVDDELRAEFLHLRCGRSQNVHSHRFGERFARFHNVQGDRSRLFKRQFAVVVVFAVNIILIRFAEISRIARVFVVIVVVFSVVSEIQLAHFTEFALVLRLERNEIPSHFAHETAVRSRSVLRQTNFRHAHRFGIVFE